MHAQLRASYIVQYAPCGVVKRLCFSIRNKLPSTYEFYLYSEFFCVIMKKTTNFYVLFIKSTYCEGGAENER